MSRLRPWRWKASTWSSSSFRSGGETVYVSSKHPNGLLPAEYKRLLKYCTRVNARWGWRMMRRDMGVYARGAVRFMPTHATITLIVRGIGVMMNTETQSRTMRNVAFLD